MNDLKGPVSLLAALVVLFIVISLAPSPDHPRDTSGAVVAEEGYSRMNPPPAPALTPEIIAMLEKSAGFRVLVSYTDHGFEPSTATIKKGETVRFTNNSNREVWVSATDTVTGGVYPGSGNDCGQSVFDSCQTLAPGEFWEFTFDQSGIWGYQNHNTVTDSGAVIVKQ